MSCDELLSEEWPTVWRPFAVEVRPDGRRLEVVATGRLDAWTAGALLRNLIAACEPSYREVHLDLRGVDASEDADPVLAHCRTFVEDRRMRYLVSGPPPSADHPLMGLPAAGG